VGARGSELLCSFPNSLQEPKWAIKAPNSDVITDPSRKYSYLRSEFLSALSCCTKQKPSDQRFDIAKRTHSSHSVLHRPWVLTVRNMVDRFMVCSLSYNLKLHKGCVHALLACRSLARRLWCPKGISWHAMLCYAES
jgi:hypothetical protein